jgi:hypothetical protein
MAVHKVDKVAGLLTAPNELQSDKGNLLRAENVVIRTPGVVEPRRGFAQDLTATFTTNTSPVTGFTYWKSGVLAYNQQGAFSFVGGVAQLNTSGSFYGNPPDAFRQRPVSSNGNLYFPTSTGSYYFEKSTAPTDPRQAGFLQPPDVFATLVGSVAVNASGSWLAADSSVAYRVVFGYYDANKNFKLSAPSGRYVVDNRILTSCSVERLTASATVTVTKSNHGLAVGDTFTLTPGNGAGAGQYNTGNYTVATVLSTSQFTYTGFAGNGTSVTAALTGKTISRGTRYVNLKIYPGSDISSYYPEPAFYRVYRTNSTPSATIDPGDEMFLVYEKTFTTAEVTARVVSYDDKTPTISQAVPLYTNPNSGSGIGSAKARPPRAKDQNVWGGRMWYANTKGYHTLSINMLGVGAPDGLQTGDRFYWPEGSYEFDGIEPGTPTQNVARAVQQIVQSLNSTRYLNDEERWYLTAFTTGASGNDSSSFTILQPYYSFDPFTFFTDRPSAFAPQVVASGSAASGTTITAVYTGGVNINVNVTTAAPHGFSTDDYVVLTENLSNGFAGVFRAGIYKVFVGSATTFTYTQTVGASNSFTGNATTTGLYQKFIPNTTTTSDNNVQVAGLYYSELDEPEAVPPLNYSIVGDSSQAILRIFPQEDRLLVFKEDGLYAVTGQAPFRVDIFDQTCILAAPDSICSMNNQVYALTTKGVARIDAGGVQVISKPIDNIVRRLLQSDRLTALRQYTWCMSYENEMEYILAVPDPDDGSPSISKLQLVFNAATGSWTTWNIWASGGFVSPVVSTYGEKIFLGTNRYESGGVYTLWNERKALNGTDYSDYGFAKTISSLSGDNLSLTLNNVTDLAIGDVVLQGSAYGLITAINGSVVTVIKSAGSAAYTATSCTVFKAISCDIQFISAYADDPTSLKQFRENTFFFRSRKFYDANASFLDAWSSTEQSVGLDFADRAVETTYNITTRVPPWNKRVLVPSGKQQSSYLNVGFNMRQARAYFALNGFSLVYDLKTDRNSR